MIVVLMAVTVAAIAAAATAVPLAWMLMLALGNFGLSQYGFIDVWPAAIAIALAFGCAGAKSS